MSVRLIWLGNGKKGISYVTDEVAISKSDEKVRNNDPSVLSGFRSMGVLTKSLNVDFILFRNWTKLWWSLGVYSKECWFEMKVTIDRDVTSEDSYLDFRRRIGPMPQ